MSTKNYLTHKVTDTPPTFSDVGDEYYSPRTNILYKKNNNNKNVTGITYDAFDRLVIKTFKKIYTEGIKKFKLKKAKVFIEHAKGYVTLGKPSIIIAVSCKHRSEAYQLSRYLIEQIKMRAPIWKKEYYKNQKSEWLKGTAIKIWV